MTIPNVKPVTEVAAVVVWYHPTPEYLNNLASYAGWVGHTWVIDNSAADHAAWLSKHLNVTYISLGGNRGIAHALNESCRLASNAGYGYILTMDQDSYFDAGQLHQHLDEALKVIKNDNVAIVAAGFEDINLSDIPELRECDSVITSGNLLDLAAWSTVGGFDGKLFIDQVDHEFCYRLRRHGYRILINGAVTMHHEVGDPLVGKFLGRRVHTSNHGWIRRYYHMRNSLYLRQKYPEYSKPLSLFLRDVRDHCLGIILLEQQIGLKLKAMALGAWDFFRERYGDWDDIRSTKR